MVFSFFDKDVCSDAFGLILTYTLQYGNNQNEREKIKKISQIIFNGIFDFEIQTNDFNGEDTDEKILTQVSEIENKIFDKIYSYLT